MSQLAPEPRLLEHDPTPRRAARLLARLGSGISSLTLAWPLMIVLFTVALLLNVGMGAFSVSPDRILIITLNHLGEALDKLPWLDPVRGAIAEAANAIGINRANLGLTADITRQQDSVVWIIRLPRTLMAASVGAGLAICGAAMQGMFRNPLADPSLIGVSSGSALGAVFSIVFGVTILGAWTLPVFAFVGGLVTTAVVYLIARHGGRAEVVTLLLAGVALNAIAGAGIGLLLSIAGDAQLRNATFWTLGSLGGTRWLHVGIVSLVTAIGLVIILRHGTALNLLTLGEREARHLGVSTERVRLILVITTAAMTGAAVAFTGTIGFIGLIVPHLIRLWLGPDHRRLLPLAAITGASLLLFADLISRTAAAPSEFPIGVTMSLAGGPFFIWLLLRTRREQGGWA